MNIKFIGKCDEKTEGGLVSFWCARTKYSFYITYEDNEDVEIFEKELKLNFENQLNLEVSK